MAQVSIGHIEAAIQKVDSLDDNALDRLSEAQTTAQPVLLGYIMSAAQEYQNEGLESLLIYYFTVVLESFSQAGLHPKSVTDELIDNFEEPYFQLLDEYFETEDESILEEFSDQPDLVKFMAMEIGTEDAKGVTLDDETATQLFIVILAMISLLSRSLD
ncbi:hypothetical protein [Fluviicola sp.]|jgi:hypothetical protein|uniref:hypothetical protein n=1 Tax=Fluviicola sp. TaxID=1917219 RepID=UPI0028256C5D|nr:hypothetical protein [Fluviicola sp.]MDR0801031.1 hypothetical protein [Fluviicola sp.]